MPVPNGNIKVETQIGTVADALSYMPRDEEKIAPTTVFSLVLLFAGIVLIVLLQALDGTRKAKAGVGRKNKRNVVKEG